MKKLRLSAGIDVGGSKILGVLYDAQKQKTYAVKKQPIDKTTLTSFIKQLTTEINRLQEACLKISGQNLTEIGIGIPGLIKNNRVINCPNLQILNDQLLGRKLTTATGLKKIILDNDLNCFLRTYLKKHSEYRRGSLIVLALGTGIGGSIALNGKNIINQPGISSEIGHSIINPETGQDLEHYYHELIGQPASHLFAVAEKNQSAQIKIEKFAKILAATTANLNNIFNPTAFILTGGVSKYYKYYLPTVKKLTKQASFTKNQPVWRIGHDQKAAAIGACLLIEALDN
ncbi:MAG TPA: ROK family protein [bacterium]|nr:ROK family protein [bacterium]